MGADGDGNLLSPTPSPPTPDRALTLSHPGRRMLVALVLGGLIGSYTLDYSWLDAAIVMLVLVLSMLVSIAVDRRMPHKAWAMAMAVFGVLPLLLLPTVVALLWQSYWVLFIFPLTIGALVAFAIGDGRMNYAVGWGLMAWIGLGLRNAPFVLNDPQLKGSYVDLGFVFFLFYLIPGYALAVFGGVLGALIRRGLMRLASAAENG